MVHNSIDSNIITSSSMASNTVVTACNKRYLWGATLLIASIRYCGSNIRIHVLSSDLDDQDVIQLEQFGNVKVIQSDSQFPHLNKPEAIFTASTDYITWIDADCIFVGNIEDDLIPINQSFQIRFRPIEENSALYRKTLNRKALNRKKEPLPNNTNDNDNDKGIPQDILNQWREDVGERLLPRFETQCVSNCFTLHRRHLPFIEKWSQCLNRFNMDPANPIDRGSLAYNMTDESVLSALLLFAHESPSLCDYQLNKTKHHCLMHFGMQDKPWKCWQKAHLDYYEYIMSILEWTSVNGYYSPDLPNTLNRAYKAQTYRQSSMRHWYLQIRHSLAVLTLPS